MDKTRFHRKHAEAQERSKSAPDLGKSLPATRADRKARLGLGPASPRPAPPGPRSHPARALLRPRSDPAPTPLRSAPRKPAQHGGSRQQKRKRLRWNASARPGSGAYTCSRKARGRPQRGHARTPGPGRPAPLSHAGRPPTLLGNCALRSRHAGASSAKPSSTALGPATAMIAQRSRRRALPGRKRMSCAYAEGGSRCVTRRPERKAEVERHTGRPDRRPTSGAEPEVG